MRLRLYSYLTLALAIASVGWLVFLRNTHDKWHNESWTAVVRLEQLPQGFVSRPCPPGIGRFKTVCGFLRTGSSRNAVDLAVTIVVSKNPLGTPPVLYIDGGPGQALSGQLETHLPALEPILARHSLIFVDQRGTGRTRPSLHCPELSNSAQSARQCFERLQAGFDVGSVTRKQLSRDLSRVRTALGLKRWAVLGVSDGTETALLLSELEPQTITALALDSLPARQNPSSLASSYLKQIQRTLRSNDALAGATGQVSLEQFLVGPSEPGVPLPTRARRAQRLTRAQNSHGHKDAVPRALVGSHQPERKGETASLALGTHLSLVCSERTATNAPLGEKPPAVLAPLHEALSFDPYADWCEGWPVKRQKHIPRGSRSTRTLFLFGAADPLAGVERATDLSQSRDNAEIVSFDALSHMVTQKPCASRLLSQWLRGSLPAKPTSGDCRL